MVDLPHVFIGHGGGSPLWRELKDYIEEFAVEVQTFESRPRFGRVAAAEIWKMLDWANFAFLVHTGEDETLDGALRARQNVVHETGMFQGKLGYDRAIVLREDGVEGFSNTFGILEIKFPKGDIVPALGNVSRVLRDTFRGI